MHEDPRKWSVEMTDTDHTSFCLPTPNKEAPAVALGTSGLHKAEEPGPLLLATVLRNLHGVARSTPV